MVNFGMAVSDSGNLSEFDVCDLTRADQSFRHLNEFSDHHLPANIKN